MNSAFINKNSEFNICDEVIVTDITKNESYSGKVCRIDRLLPCDYGSINATDYIYVSFDPDVYAKWVSRGNIIDYDGNAHADTFTVCEIKTSGNTITLLKGTAKSEKYSPTAYEFLLSPEKIRGILIWRVAFTIQKKDGSENRSLCANCST